MTQVIYRVICAVASFLGIVAVTLILKHNFNSEYFLPLLALAAASAPPLLLALWLALNPNWTETIFNKNDSQQHH